MLISYNWILEPHKQSNKYINKYKITRSGNNEIKVKKNVLEFIPVF